MSGDFRLRMMPRSVLRGQVLPRFPASVNTLPPLTLSQSGLTYTFGIDVAALKSTIGLFDAVNAGLVPASGGGTTNFLRADGSWVPGGTGSGTPGGANTQIQFNDSSAFGGDTDFTWNKTTNTLAFGSGAIIDWNAGDVTLTHSLNTLTISGASTVSIGITGELVCGSIQLGNLSDTSLTRVSAGVVAIEGVNIDTVSGTATLTNKTINLASNALTGTAAQFSTACSDADFYTTGGTDVALADGGTGASLTAPTVDRLLMWDQGAPGVRFGQLANITTEASPTGGDFLLLQKQGTDDLKKVDWSSLPGIGGGAPTTPSYLTLSADATLSAERTLTAGTGITFADAGPNSTLTLNVSTPSLITVANEAADTTCFPAFFTAATGDLGPKSNANLTYNSLNNIFSIATSGTFVCGQIELGALSDTTLSRVSAGTVAVEGANILTSLTGQPLDADLTSWAAITRAAGFDTFTATPSSANLAALVTGETGSGALVFNVSPTFTTPILGTPTSGTLTNCAGLPTVLTANEVTDTTCFPLFATAAGAASPGTELGPKTNASLIYNAATGALGATTLELGGAIDVTLSRSGVGTLAIEGVNILTTATGLASSRQIISGGGLTGGGDLSADRTLAVGAGTGIVVNADDVAIDTTVVARKTDNLSVFAATTSALLAGVISDETGSGLLVFATSPTLTTPQINDSAANNRYIFAAADLAADRTISLPLLGANDTFVFQAFAQSLTNKTIALGSNTVTGSVSDFNTALTGADFYTTGGTDVALADGGTGASLTAPSIDRLLMWDQGTSSVAFGTLANITTETTPTSGDFLLIQKQGSDDLKKVDWASLPGASGATQAFGTIQVSGQSDVVADAAPDILTLIAGSNITITTNAATDAITIAASGGSSLADGDYGDITVSGGGTVLTIDPNVVTNGKLRDSGALSVIGNSTNAALDPADISATASSDAVLRESGSTIGWGTIATAGIGNAQVTYAKIQNVTATDRVLGRSSAGAGTIEEITCTLAGRNLLDDADAAAQRTTLGLAAGATSALATTGEVWAGTASTLLTPLNVLNALAAVGLTFGATISVDLALGVFFTVTLTGAATLGNPTNPKVGRTIYFRVSQDGTGTRTLSYGSNYDFGQDSAPTLTTAGSAQDLIAFFVSTTTKLIYLGIRQNIG